LLVTAEVRRRDLLGHDEVALVHELLLVCPHDQSEKSVRLKVIGDSSPYVPEKVGGSRGRAVRFKSLPGIPPRQ
jgi:hypothetical protein